MTTSFGSICFGSFLVAILQALRAIAQSARENGDAQILACIAECILGCLASILEYFNKVRTTHVKQFFLYDTCRFVSLICVFVRSFVLCQNNVVGLHLCWIVRYAVYESGKECL